MVPLARLLSGAPFNRQRVLDELIPLAPLTVVAGIPGTAKSHLLRSLHQELADRRGKSGPPLVLVDFPRRRLGETEVLAAAGEAVLGTLGREVASSDLASGLQRGQLDSHYVEGHISEMAARVPGSTLVLANYEWQATDLLDRVLVQSVKSGLDVVCSAVDPTPLEACAKASGVTTRVVADADLVLTAEEVAELARALGLGAAPELVGSTLALTAGVPMLVVVMLLKLSGVESLEVGGGTMRLVGTDGERRLVTPSEGIGKALGPPAPISDRSLREFGPEELRSAASLLRQEEFALKEFMGSPQGSSSFLRIVTNLSEVRSVDLDALEAVAPGGIRVADRLRAAGYAHLELGRHISGRLVWNEGVRAVVSDWGRVASPRGDKVPVLPSLASELVDWYESQGRLDDAIELLEGMGDTQELDRFAGRHFVDLVLDPFDGVTTGTFVGTSVPGEGSAVSVLVALRAHLALRDDQRLTAHLDATVALLRSKLGTDDPAERVRVVAELFVAEALLDHWEETPDLDALALAAVDDALSEGLIQPRDAGRALLLFASLALIKGSVVAARKAISRALATVSTDSGTWRSVAVVACVLEAYFGGPLFDRHVDRNSLLDAELENAIAGAGWDEWIVIVRLARAWRAVSRGEFGEGRTELEQLARERQWVLAQPFMLWSLGLQKLLSGDVEGARALYSDERGIHLGANVLVGAGGEGSGLVG